MFTNGMITSPFPDSIGITSSPDMIPKYMIFSLENNDLILSMTDVSKLCFSERDDPDLLIFLISIIPWLWKPEGVLDDVNDDMIAEGTDEEDKRIVAILLSVTTSVGFDGSSIICIEDEDEDELFKKVLCYTVMKELIDKQVLSHIMIDLSIQSNAILMEEIMVIFIDSVKISYTWGPVDESILGG
ncbi:hypothetical protein L6452_31788 [Arctium lappa]|uniref:Uncharacterized protein n=1 Tax=Arctium lappa TaxID=4217 RepID=A0ACB8Z2U7_ARCLA|nr:hypothetical protein L6452_31788 [Arctium lappa]